MKKLLRRILSRVPRRSEGFSLVEVVIALAVLAIAFFGMIGVITYTARMNASTRERMWAMRAAERKIEQMLSTKKLEDIYNYFSVNVEGQGWERVMDSDTTGISTTLSGKSYEVLKPIVDPTVPGVSSLDVSERTTETGYIYPTSFGNGQAVLFVRFPLNAAGTGLTEVNAGLFAGLGAATPNLDLDQSGTAGDQGNLTALQCKILPVSIEVYWKGIVGPSTGGKGNTYLRYRYTFLRTS